MLTWFVVYTDGSTHSYSPDFTISNINVQRLEKFVLHLEGSETPLVMIHFDDSRKRPIYVKRIELPNGHHSFKVVCHIIGWQMNVGGENIQSINYTFETIGREEGEMYWVENGGKFDNNRSTWTKSPSQEQLNVIGSKQL